MDVPGYICPHCHEGPLVYEGDGWYECPTCGGSAHEADDLEVMPEEE